MENVNAGLIKKKINLGGWRVDDLSANLHDIRADPRISNALSATWLASPMCRKTPHPPQFFLLKVCTELIHCLSEIQMSKIHLSKTFDSYILP